MIYTDIPLLLMMIIMFGLGALFNKVYINYIESFERSIPLHKYKELELIKKTEEVKKRLKKNRRLNSINNEIFIV